MVSTCRIICLSACKKSTSPLPSFLRYSKDIRNFLFWILWASLAMTNKKRYYQCRESFDVYFQAKKSPFLKYCKDNANLLSWVIWAHLAKPTKNNSVIFYETQMLICEQKINLIPQFFYWYYTLKNPAM